MPSVSPFFFGCGYGDADTFAHLRRSRDKHLTSALFQGSSANSDGRTDAHHHNIPTFSPKKHGDNDVHNVHIAIYPHFKFHEKILKTFKCDRQTHRQTDTQSANHKSTPVKPVRDSK
ncbi:hypothetical protein DPMN_024733 [Dreissena polymorpha]|uniref:Uncharacterized protein n=1 Tax=Dreissena polymorpha TaxID=45954 RepID=A0A9D4LQA9_DREPO|nr:hypothetical protein DPMN_024733 [Dreissena polymorpha]